MLGNTARTLGMVLLYIASVSSYAHDAPPNGKTSLAPMLENVTPAVVNISASKINRGLMSSQFWGTFPQPENRRRNSAGSGLIVDAINGYVLTNNHVIDEAEDIMVTLLDRREFEASIVGRDPDTDLAVLKIDANDLQELQLGNSDELRVGDFVVAIGNPFGVGQTVTSGIVSALGRTGLGIEKYEDFIQTDASINPGNSGGPLVDLEGNVIGINTAIIGNRSIGIGFAIPSSMVATVLTQLIEHGQVSRGVLGIEGETISREIADIYELESLKGTIVTNVIEGSSADRAGLQIKDIIVAIDDKEVKDWHSLRAQLGLKRVGDIVKVDFVRDGTTRSVKASILDTSEVFGKDLIPGLSGVSLADISQSNDNYQHVRGKGVVIDEIKTSSSAYNIGFRKDDIIIHLNRYRVESLEQLRALVSLMEEIRGIRVYRDGRTYTFLI